MNNFISKALLLLLQILIMNKKERAALFNILFFPILFLIIMWMVKLIEEIFVDIQPFQEKFDDFST